MGTAYSGDKPDIAIVDDEVEVLQFLVNLLAHDFNVYPFTKGEGLFLHLNRRLPVDLILLDADMPAPDGYEACTRLRLIPEMAEIPVVFMTGHDAMEAKLLALELGGADYISKPLSAPIVLARVKHHVRLGRALRLIMEQSRLLDQRVAERTSELSKRNTELAAELARLA